MAYFPFYIDIENKKYSCSGRRNGSFKKDRKAVAF